MSNPIEALLQINVLFNNEQNIHYLPSFFSPPFLTLPSTLLLPLPENSPEKVLSSLKSGEQLALLSSYSGKKVDECLQRECRREEKCVH